MGSRAVGGREEESAKRSIAHAHLAGDRTATLRLEPRQQGIAAATQTKISSNVRRRALRTQQGSRAAQHEIR